jgi:glucuronate isomerase
MTTTGATLLVHPDRLLPPEPGIRVIARGLYESVRTLPILSPHGHVDPTMLLADERFSDPAALFVTPDHYVTRLLHASGVALEDLGVGRGRLTEPEARQAWRLLCEHWEVFRGTPVRYWLESELAEIFDITLCPSATTADAIYDQLAARLEQDAFRPQALLTRFDVDVLATTDDPVDALAAHAALAADPAFGTRVVPTFRPDRYLEAPAPGWSAAVDELGAAAATDVGQYAGYLHALEARRRHFIDHGATSTDHSHADVRTDPLEFDEAVRIYLAARKGHATAAETLAFRRHMLFEMARMSTEDGLVMTLHPAIRRDHHAATAQLFGKDTGHDIPIAVEFTDALRPLLDRFGTAAGFHLVLFTTDETVFSREIAPLAGFYPAVFAGAPWWFLDAPDAISRYRAAITETAGFSRTSGFVDDTRALCSIPARHDMSRRLDSAYLARLVAEHRLSEEDAAATLRELVNGNPRRAFKL